MAKRHPNGVSTGQWRWNWLSLFVALIALIGMGIFIYPSTASWWAQYHESKAIVAYTSVVELDPPPGNAQQVGEAMEYNRALSTGNIDVSATSNKPVVVGDDEDQGGYWELLQGHLGMIGRLKISSIDVDLPIYHGTSDDVLAKGVGHLQGTSLPVGGIDTHSVLTAHTGLASATLFNNLNKVQIGDTFTIAVFGEILTYQAIELQTVLPDETQALVVQSDQDLVTLVTCTPLGINTHRYLVTGKRITPTPLADIEAAAAAPVIPGFPWWAVIIPGGIVLAGLYVWRSGYPPKPKKQKPMTIPPRKK